jgi:hypothetical protein
MDPSAIISAIDSSPLNRGLSGAVWLAEPGNIAIVDGEDIALFDDEGDNVYEMHVLFKSRGRAAIDAGKASLRRMFEDHNASLIFAKVPAIRPDVNLFARWIGLKFIGLRSTAYGPCHIFALPREMQKGDDQ